METDDLIAQLSQNLAPARPHAVMRLLGAGLLLGLVAAAILLQATLHFRHNLAAVLMVPGFFLMAAAGFYMCFHFLTREGKGATKGVA